MAISKYETVMKAAGDRTRVRILKLLEEGRMNVGEIRQVLSLSQSTVSGPLSLLSRAGLVQSQQEGRRTWYYLSAGKDNSFAPPMLALLLGWLDDDPQVLADRRRLKAMRVSG